MKEYLFTTSRGLMTLYLYLPLKNRFIVTISNDMGLLKKNMSCCTIDTHTGNTATTRAIDSVPVPVISFLENVEVIF
jgi:hypothetical protein